MSGQEISGVEQEQRGRGSTDVQVADPLPGAFSSLEGCVLHEVLVKLPPSHLRIVAETCRAMASYLKSEWLWKCMTNARGFVSSEEKVGKGWKQAYAGLHKVRPVGFGAQPFDSIRRLAEVFRKKAAHGGISVPPGHHALCVEGSLTVGNEEGVSSVRLSEDVSFAGDVWSLGVEFPTSMIRRPSMSSSAPASTEERNVILSLSLSESRLQDVQPNWFSIISAQVLLMVDYKVSGPIANGVVAFGEVPAGMQVHSLIPEVPEGGVHTLKCTSWSHLGPTSVSALCDPRVVTDLGLATHESDIKVILLIKDIQGSRKYYRELYGAILLRASSGQEALRGVQGGGCLIRSSVEEWWHTFLKQGKGGGGRRMVDFVLQVGGCYRMVSNEQYTGDPAAGVRRLVDLLLADQAQNPHTWECPILATGHVWESFRCEIRCMWEAWLQAATTEGLTIFAQDRVLWSWIEALGSAELMPIRLATTQLFLVLHGVISDRARLIAKEGAEEDEGSGSNKGRGSMIEAEEDKSLLRILHLIMNEIRDRVYELRKDDVSARVRTFCFSAAANSVDRNANFGICGHTPRREGDACYSDVIAELESQRRSLMGDTGTYSKLMH